MECLFISWTFYNHSLNDLCEVLYFYYPSTGIPINYNLLCIPYKWHIFGNFKGSGISFKWIYLMFIYLIPRRICMKGFLPFYLIKHLAQNLSFSFDIWRIIRKYSHNYLRLYPIWLPIFTKLLSTYYLLVNKISYHRRLWITLVDGNLCFISNRCLIRFVPTESDQIWWLSFRPCGW